jgi:hypothetical protein
VSCFATRKQTHATETTSHKLQYLRRPFETYNHKALQHDNIMNAGNNMCASRMSNHHVQHQKTDFANLSHTRWSLENLSFNPVRHRSQIGCLLDSIHSHASSSPELVSYGRSTHAPTRSTRGVMASSLL